MNAKTYHLVTMVVFGLVALLQFLRMFLGWPVSIGGVAVPMFASTIAFVVAGGLATWAFLLMRKSG